MKSFRSRLRNDAPPAPVEDDDDDDVFALIPPRAETIERVTPRSDPARLSAMAAASAAVSTASRFDMSRVAIDEHGRLHFDGRPVELRQRLALSGPQKVGVALMAALLCVAAFGGAIQGAATAHDAACRAGWIAGPCGAIKAPPPSGSNIPT